MPAGVLLTDGTTGGLQVLADGRTVTYELPAEESLVPGVLGRGDDGTGAAITMDGRHLLLHGRTGAGWEVVPLP